MIIFFLFSFKLEGQYRFDFENDSSEVFNCCSGPEWIHFPEGRWSCDSINPIEGKLSLHHCFDNTQEACDYLVFRHDPLNLTRPFTWSFRIRHGYAPSSQNNWQLILGAELNSQLKSGDMGSVEGEPVILNGIVLGVNFTGADDLVKIWQIKGGLTEILCTTGLNYQEDVGTAQAPQFTIRWDGEDGLELFFSADPHSEEPLLVGSCQLEGLEWGRHLLLRYRYTSSRDMALWLDDLDLDGHFVKDTVPPRVNAVEFEHASCLQLIFSEEVIIPGPFSFILYSEENPEGIYPDSVLVINEVVKLLFPDEIPNRVPQELRLEGLLDFDGNCMRVTMVDVMRNEVQWGDLVFNEVMADPEPAIRYHEEYLELYMRSEYPLDPEGWQLKVNEREYILHPSMLEPSPGGFMVLKGITLPNDGAILSLHNAEGQVIHAASYRLPWNGSRWKKEGGWSLESPDPDLLCRISVNWEFSSDPGGGSPGRINSNAASLVDREPPLLLYAGLGKPGELLLHYSEPLRLPVHEEASISLSPGGIVPDSFRVLDPLWEILQVNFQENFQEWTVYQLSVSGLSDCAGNESDPHKLKAGAVAQPEASWQPGAVSVVINEIMYDPDETCPEYVELFLPGNRIFDLQDFAIHLVEEGGSPDNPLVLTPHSRLILPGQYLVLTASVPHLMEAYGLEMSGQWVEVEELSGLDKSSGVIYLSDRAGNVVDMAVYSDDLHMELLDDPRGISLERVRSCRAGSDPDNWHSAASLAGYATPGRENSQSLDGEAWGEASDHRLVVEPEVFSPDNDGFNDLLNITISTGGNDWLIGLLITDLQGNRIRVLANNHLAGPSHTYTWDGEGEGGSMQTMGFYVIHARAYHSVSGESWIRRKAVGLVYR